MNEQSFPISLLRQYVFCNRIPYLVECRGVQVRKPEWAIRGIINHNDESQKMERRTFRSVFDREPLNLHFDVELYSLNYELHGKADTIFEFEDEIVIGEIKRNLPFEKSAISKGWLLQGYAYGLLAEEMFGKPFNGLLFISYSGRKDKERYQLLKVTQEHKRWVLDEIALFVNMLKGATLPESSAQMPRCAQCEYLNFCNDRGI